MKTYAGLQLVGGHPALDFLNTVEYRGEPAPGDRLSSFQELAGWSAAAGVISQSELPAIIAHGSRRSQAASRAVRSATELREALYSVMVAGIGHSPLPRAPSRLIEREFRAARAAAQLGFDAGRSAFWWHIPLQKPEDLVARLADSANDLVLSLGKITVHQCEGPDCDWLFIDRSHGHRRQWCQPAKCGNLVRVRRARAR